MFSLNKKSLTFIINSRPSTLLFLRSKHIKRSQRIPTPFERAPIIMHSKVQQIALAKDDDKSTTAGRTVKVGNNAMAGYRKLWAILSFNKTRYQVKRNRYYEKPFLRRQRVKWEFEQKKFKDAVKKKIQLILQMKARGI
ncbi:107_t:CDS:2 [Funneliformis caledonium]|uniref:107_t:CDS:1 n=1 Tax=Funneliformis caledonium TaxID=1117310 RepID=A0A9N9AU36_9GLOM|nr:107_t:CDS:2 [Funneliformis caledonium]